MVSSNQRAIHEGLSKVIGSSNRGFASTDPERQPTIVTQGGKKPAPDKTVPATGSTAVPGGQEASRR